MSMYDVSFVTGGTMLEIRFRLCGNGVPAHGQLP
jgi:hypothetical protein